MGEVILDTLLDTVKLLPFLYLTYLLMEFLEHRSGNTTEKLLRRSGAVGPLLGGTLGVIPQCGFSAAAAGLYAGRVVSIGTLLAVFLSTSDEMLPVLISERVSFGVIARILLVKWCIAVAVGFAVDAVFRLFPNKGTSGESAFEEICEREHCHCEDHFAWSAFKHTLRIAGFLLLLSFLLNTGVHFVGEERLSGMIYGKPGSHLLSALFGLIPNCASSVLITKLSLSGVLSVGAMFSGLLVNAGIGLLVLFRNNRPAWDSLRLVGILFLVGVLFGFLLDLTPISAWVGI